MTPLELTNKWISEICAEHHLNPTIFLNPKRRFNKRELVVFKILVNGLRERGWNLEKIGAKFFKDHSTISHHLGRHRKKSKLLS